jgi:hypothetical protein
VWFFPLLNENPKLLPVAPKKSMGEPKKIDYIAFALSLVESGTYGAECPIQIPDQIRL